MFFLLDLDCHEQGWYLHRTTTGDQNKKSSEEYFKYQNYLYLIVTTIPVKVIVIRNTKLFCTFFNVLEVFYKHHIYVLFFSVMCTDMGVDAQDRNFIDLRLVIQFLRGEVK